MTDALDFPRTIHNPVTGDAITFVSSPLSGDGETLVFRCVLPARATGAPLHSHAEMTETFIIEAGLLEIDLGGGDIRRLGPGESIRLEPGTEHGFRNPLATETRFLNVSTPGLELEKFLRAIYGLAAEGRANADGMPANPLALATTLASTDMIMSSVPKIAQRIAVSALAGVARLTGAARPVLRIWTPTPAGQVQ